MELVIHDVTYSLHVLADFHDGEMYNLVLCFPPGGDTSESFRKKYNIIPFSQEISPIEHLKLLDVDEVSADIIKHFNLV